MQFYLMFNNIYDNEGKSVGISSIDVTYIAVSTSGSFCAGAMFDNIRFEAQSMNNLDEALKILQNKIQTYLELKYNKKLIKENQKWHDLRRIFSQIYQRNLKN